MDPAPDPSPSATRRDPWERIGLDFPVNKNLIWLNNCGTAPASLPAIGGSRAFLEAYAEQGYLGVAGMITRAFDALRASLAGLLGCGREELALIHHTSEGMNFISYGLSLSPGDRILLLKDEYPSNVYPWRHWERKGVRIEFVDPGLSADELLSNFERAFGPDVKVVAFSAAHWCTGRPVPLAPIGEACERTGALLVVDGAQGVGMLDLDLKALKVKAMACSAWKWLLGPLGLGVLFIDRDFLPHLRPVFMSTQSVVRDETYLPYRDELKPDASRYIISTPNYADWFYFEKSLELLQGLGWAAVRARLSLLGETLARDLLAAGFKVLGTDGSGPPSFSPMVVAEAPGRDAAALVRGLRQKGVVAAERLGRLRFSPHVYLSPAQLHEAVRILQSL